MAFPLQITFRHLPPSRIFENRIHELARRLEKFSDRIVSCHVAIEQAHQSSGGRGAFTVHITLALPGSTIVVQRSNADDLKCDNAYVTLRDAFSTAKRRLQEYQRMGRGEVKTHAVDVARASAP